MKKIYLLICLLFALCSIAYPAINESGTEWFLKARPCWASGGQLVHNQTILLHSVVELNNPESVVFNITAASCYRLYLNGEFVGYGPSIAAHNYFRVDEYDLKDKTKPGKNIIAVEVVGYNVDNFYIPNQSSFVQAELMVDGEVRAATINQNNPIAFAVGVSNQRVSDVPKLSFQRPYMETYQLENDYNAWRKEENFVLAKVGVEEADKKMLLPRRVKYPDYTILDASKQLNNGIMCFETVKTGFIMTHVTVSKPSKIRLHWDEVLIDGEMKAGRLGYNSYIDYELAPGEYNLETFEPYTFMFVKVDVREGDCVLNGASVRQYVNSDVSKAFFETNDFEINKIFKAAVETYKQNALDVFMDCPSRERAGWLCDSYFTSRVAFNLSGNTLIERNFLENYLLPSKFKNIPEGMIPMCYPSDHADGNFIPNWSMWFILQLEEYFQRSLDYQMIASLKPRVLNLLNYFKRFENEDGLLESLDKWIFVEWSQANDFVRDVNYPTNMLYSRALEVAGRLYSIPEYADKAKDIKNVIREQAFVNGFFSDNAIREGDRLIVQAENQTEVCQYFAFFFDVATPDSHADLWMKLVADFGAKRKETDKYPHIYPANAFIGNYVRLELLAREGKTQELINEMKKQFLYMADMTGTLWEDIKPGTSTCHGFASHAAHVLIRDIAGVERVDLINKEVIVNFKEIDIKNCELSLPIGEKTLYLKWTKKGRIMNYQIEVPEEFDVKVFNNTSYSLKKKVY